MRRHAAASVRLAVVLIVIGAIRWGAYRLVPALGEPDAVEAASQPAAPSSQLSRFRGVVLFVAKPREQVAAPPPPVDPLRPKTAAERQPESLVLPFSGAYWLYRRPDLRPPGGALIRYGEPDRLFFRADDGIPLRMEAHQHLGRHLTLSCCRSLDVELTSTDRFPSGVEAELLLVDTATQGNQSLGMRPLPMPPFELPGAARPPIESRLTFPVSPGRLLRFDQISVRFHLVRLRVTQSARVAIRRFTLRP